MADYYPEDESGEPMEAEGEAEEAAEGVTALLPKSILAGKEFNVGDEVVLKIVHKYDDEIEVAYATEEPPEEKEMSAGDELDMMDKGGGGRMASMMEY